MFLRLEVNKPAKMRIIPCPNANKNNIKIAKEIFLPIAAKAIIPAKIGVEHGVPARANVTPKSTGYKKMEFVEFAGMALIIVGVSKSKIPISFKPITIKSEATISVKYAPIAEAKTLPVMAHAMPIIEKTIAVPKIKQQSCKNVIKGVSLEYPPTYPMISGSIASEQGDNEARIPPAKETKSKTYHAV